MVSKWTIRVGNMYLPSCFSQLLLPPFPVTGTGGTKGWCH